MAKSLTGFFVVFKGHKTGLFLNWDDCSEQIENYPNSKFRRFLFKRNALDFMKKQKIYARYIYIEFIV
jgi:ribonuclease HI